MGAQPLRLRNHNSGLAQRIMVKRLATSPHDPVAEYPCGNLETSTCVTLNGSGIQLAMGAQPLRLRNHNSGLAQRIMVKRLATSPHDPVGITDSACKNQSVVVSVQYGPFNPFIPIRSTTIGKSRVARDPIAMHTSWRSNSDIAIVTRAFKWNTLLATRAWLRPVSRGNRHFTVDCGRLRQSGPRPETGFLRQPALEGLTRSARTDSPPQDWPEQIPGKRRRAPGGGVEAFERRGAALIALGIGYPRMSASGESSTTMHRLLHASGSHPIPPPDDPKISDGFCHGRNLLVVVIETSPITRQTDGGGAAEARRWAAAVREFPCGNHESSTCVTLNGSGIQLAVGPQPLWLRNHNFGLAHRIMVKRLATLPHDPLGITDSASKNQLVMVSVQYGPFNTYIPIRSTTIGKSRVAKDPIAMHTSSRSNSDIASVTSIGYPRMKASGESSTTKHRLLHASGHHPIPPPNDPK
ncbi:hypothetical protein F511_12658 [Dorcoceras hygrometricum]|uniref:Uncharacterized protein n=1 Tax=Dorcoceras hygrometricum TaxID=472368 RepID=A0A2Z7C6I1_9LAMI|nr:hypothetical protein F511_12658 [Dorcoceras hygrometricum]